MNGWVGLIVGAFTSPTIGGIVLLVLNRGKNTADTDLVKAQAEKLVQDIRMVDLQRMDALIRSQQTQIDALRGDVGAMGVAFVEVGRIIDWFDSGAHPPLPEVSDALRALVRRFRP